MLANKCHILAKIPFLRKLTQIVHNYWDKSPLILSAHCEISVASTLIIVVYIGPDELVHPLYISNAEENQYQIT